MAYAALFDVANLLGAVESGDEAALTLALEAASQVIDRQIGRSFTSTASETRYFSTAGGSVLRTGDLVSASSVAYAHQTGGTYTVLTSAQYFLGGGDGVTTPYQWVQLADTGSFPTFGTGINTVRIIGVWGWPAVPAAVKHLTLAIAIRAWRAGRAGYSRASGIPGVGVLHFANDLTEIERMTLANYRQVVFA